MGHLQHKYTKEYYTGKDSKGQRLNYGATSSLDEDGNYTLRKQDKLILQRIDFKKKNVLALGCGRGEELAYVIEKEANKKNTVGVDFSAEAIKIAVGLIKKKGLGKLKFYTEDVLDFVKRYPKEIKNYESEKFDIVIMFDFVEHVPREELKIILKDLKKIIKKSAILVVNTPAYKYDDDVIKNGDDERNQINIMDTSDSIPETKGMHCNKYSTLSLQEFMKDCGFINVTETHYFVEERYIPIDFENISYHDRWNYCKEKRFSLLNGYTEDIIEVPYTDSLDLEWIKFEKGHLEGISAYITEAYKNLAFPDGETDSGMINDIILGEPKGKTIFDIGSFIGTSSMLFSKLVGEGGRVLGFEPNPFNRNRSFLNISHNPNLSSNIHIYPYALGKEDGEEVMTLSTSIDSGHSSTSRLNLSHPKLRKEQLPDGFEEMTVEMKTLDSFIKDTDIVPDILKVDIEGAEHDFLLGARETIKKYRPIFYIEIHSEFCAIRCFEILNAEGYFVTILNEEKDNRIMIKAEFGGQSRKKSSGEQGLQATRNLDSSLYLLRAVRNLLETNNKELMRVQDENERVKADCGKIKEEGERLKVENEKMKAEDERLKIENSELIIRKQGLIDEKAKMGEKKEELVKEITSLEGSRSWKITEPLRSMMKFFNKIKSE